MKLQIGVKVLLHNNRGEYLFIKRTELLQDETEVSWDIPGGRIGPDEALMTALSREIKEEIGVELSGVPRLINAQDIFVPAKHLHVVRLTYIFDTDVDLRSLRLSHEHQDAVWLSLDEATRVNTEPFLSETLKMLRIR